MHPDLITLAEADALDRELKALKKARADAEAEADAADAKAKAADARVAELEGQVAAHKARQRELNRELETYAARRASATRVLESGVGDPDAAERQLSQVAGIVDGLETELLERMEGQEQAEAALRDARAARESAVADRDRVRQALPGVVEDLRGRWDARVPRRDALLAGLDRLTRQKYLDLRDRKGSAVAEVVREACAACHQFVQPQHVADLKRGLLEPCRGCGRWLLVPSSE